LKSSENSRECAWVLLLFIPVNWKVSSDKIPERKVVANGESFKFSDHFNFQLFQAFIIFHHSAQRLFKAHFVHKFQTSKHKI
jgi:hypothetical protein